MVLATYQCADYLTWKNNRYSQIKELLNVSQEMNIYWCFAANNIYQAVVNTYTIAPNQPYWFVMFETEDFYRVDAIKWNHYVETGDESLLTEDLFEIEHEDAVEYIVTSIPHKRFEVNVTPSELAKSITDSNNKYSTSFMHYRDGLLHAWKSYPSCEEIEEMAIELSVKNNMPEELLCLRKYFTAFQSFLFLPLYLIGMDHLGLTVEKAYTVQMLSRMDITEISTKHCSIYAGYGDMETLYKRYKDFYNFIYNKIFVLDKLYPNDMCPCGSGKKYKKCCMRDNNLLYKYMIEK